MNLFLHDSKNWTLFSITQRIELFSPLNPFFKDSMNWIFSVIQRIVPSFLNVIQRIETFCWMWPKELSHCWKILRIESFYKYDWEFNPFWTFSYDSKNWTFFDMTRRIEPFFECDSKNCNFLQKVSPRMDFLECDSKNWNFFNMTQRIEIDSKHWTAFSIWRTELNISFLEYDAQNWTSLFSNMTHRIEHLISSRIWLTEFFLNMTHRIECLFLQMTHRTEHLFLQMTQRIDFF